MAFNYGDALRFKKNIPITTWVNGIYPKGQLGMVENHIGVQINQAKFHIPQSLAEQLFEIDVPEEKIIIPSEPSVIEEDLKKVDLEIQEAVLEVEKTIKKKVEKKRGRKPKVEKK